MQHRSGSRTLGIDANDAAPTQDPIGLGGGPKDGRHDRRSRTRKQTNKNCPGASRHARRGRREWRQPQADPQQVVGARCTAIDVVESLPGQAADLRHGGLGLRSTARHPLRFGHRGHPSCPTAVGPVPLTAAASCTMHAVTTWQLARSGFARSCGAPRASCCACLQETESCNTCDDDYYYHCY